MFGGKICPRCLNLFYPPQEETYNAQVDETASWATGNVSERIRARSMLTDTPIDEHAPNNQH